MESWRYREYLDRCLKTWDITQEEMQKVLKENKIDLDEDYAMDLLSDAIFSKWEETACLLFDHFMDVIDTLPGFIETISDSNIMHSAASMNMPCLVQKFINAGMDVFHEDEFDEDVTPFHCAVDYSSISVVEVLFSKEVMTKACLQKGNEHMLSLLDDLLVKATGGCEEIALKLLSSRASISQDTVLLNRFINERRLLHIAASKGMVTLLSKFLEVQADYPSSVAHNCVPLRMAVENGHKGVVELLLQKNMVGAEDKQMVKICEDLLATATNKGYEKIALKLMDKRASISQQHSSLKDLINTKHLLCVAASKGMAALVKRLFEAGGDPSLSGPDKKLPLRLAVEGGHSDVLQILASDTVIAALCNQCGHEHMLTLLNELLVHAIEQGHKKNALHLLMSRGLVSKEDTLFRDFINTRGLLSIAASKGMGVLVKKFIEAGADVDSSSLGKHPLLLAVEQGHSDIARLLIQSGCHTDWSSPILLRSVFKKCSEGIVLSIMQKGEAKCNPECFFVPANTGYCRDPLFHIAAERGMALVVEVLMAIMPHNNSSQQRFNTSPLYGAINGRRIEVVQLLLEAGYGLVNGGVDKNSLSAVFSSFGFGEECAEKSVQKLVKLLAPLFKKVNVFHMHSFFMLINKAAYLQLLEENGVVFNFASLDNKEKECILQDVRRSRTENMEFYLLHGLPPNAALAAGRNTALHHCVQYGLGMRMFLMLLQSGADPYQKNDDNLGALELCLKKTTYDKKIFIRAFLHLGYRIPEFGYKRAIPQAYKHASFQFGKKHYKTLLREKYPRVPSLQLLSAIAARRFQNGKTYNIFEDLPHVLQKIISPSYADDSDWSAYESDEFRKELEHDERIQVDSSPEGMAWQLNKLYCTPCRLNYDPERLFLPERFFKFGH